MNRILLGICAILLMLTTLQGQNVCEISCTSFAQGKALNHVKFKLLLNNNLIVEKEVKTGMFQFIMKKEDGQYALEASKEGFVPKIIRINTVDYPFEYEYEIQEIDLEFEKETQAAEDVQIGDLKWSTLNDEFVVSKTDTALERLKADYTDSKQKLDQLYVHAIVSGNEMMNIGQPAYAKGFFEIALEVKEDDEYAQSKLMEIQMAVAAQKEKPSLIDEATIDKINKGEIDSISDMRVDENIKYSVQLGAFSKSVKLEDFKAVPEFKTIEYEDYTRCFSGEFSHINGAIERKKEMIKAGYKDAWIVKLKGNERIGF